GRAHHGLLGLCLCRGKSKRSIYYLHERSLFTKDNAFGLGHGEILKRFWIRSQACTVSFISGKAVEGNQPPGDIIRAFTGKKISDQVTAASRNNAAPILGVLLERVALKRIDLI